MYDRSHEECRMVYNRAPEPKEDADTHPSVEAIVEVAVEALHSPYFNPLSACDRPVQLAHLH